MAEAMIKLVENRHLAKEMGEKGREHMRDNYTMEQHIGRINKAIKKVVLKK